MSENPWVQVRSCYWLHEAQFIVSVLEGDGIEALIPDAHTAGVRPDLGLALGGVRVLVRASDLRRAAEVLEAVVAESTDGPGEE